jgi:hypothetical protein
VRDGQHATGGAAGVKLNAVRALSFILAALVGTTALGVDATPPEARAVVPAPSQESTVRSGVLAYLALWSPDARPDAAAPFSEHVVLSYSLSIPELDAEVRGRTSVVNQVGAVARLGRGWKFGDVRVFPTLNPSVYFVQYTATATSTIDGAPIEQNVLLCVEVEESNILRIVEYSNPAISSATRRPGSSGPR